MDCFKKQMISCFDAVLPVFYKKDKKVVDKVQKMM